MILYRKKTSKKRQESLVKFIRSTIMKQPTKNSNNNSCDVIHVKKKKDNQLICCKCVLKCEY